MFPLLVRPQLVFVLAVAFVSQGLSSEFTFFHENVLGTSLELRMNATDQATAAQAESKALAEIDRLSSIYSHYDQQSEFSRFVAAPVGEHVSMSSELRTTLILCDQWKSASKGAFDPATELLAHRWRQAALSGTIPNHKAIDATVQELKLNHWQIDQLTGDAVRMSSTPLSLNAIAKGVILDRVAETLLKSTGVLGVMLNIGGDVRVAGMMSSSVDIAHPNSDAIGGDNLSTLNMTCGAVATSGISERFFTIAGKHYSHIFDPRTGMPVSQTVSASVIANDATTADAVATICSVLSIQESLAFVDSLPGIECLLMNANGVIERSANWPEHHSAKDNVTATTLVSTQPEITAHEMSIEFEIAKSDDSRRYRRPYVAVWLEDKDSFPVKTLSLFLMQNEPGPRWYRDLRRWYTDDQMRKLVDDTDLIATVSKPTRNPGSYKVNWDGNDDAGQPLKPGKYTILIESAREHGTYQLMKHEFELGTSFEKSLTPNKEVSAVKIRYVAK